MKERAISGYGESSFVSNKFHRPESVLVNYFLLDKLLIEVPAIPYTKSFVQCIFFVKLISY